MQVKICKHCNEEKTVDNFYQRIIKGRVYYCYLCKVCDNLRAIKYNKENNEKVRTRERAYYTKNKEKFNSKRTEKRRGRVRDFRKDLLKYAKRRSKIRGVEFNLSIEDIVVPLKCPVFNFDLSSNVGAPKQNSFTLDRIDSTKGYVKGNVEVISMKANAMKQNATLEEIQIFCQYYGKKLSKVNKK